MVSDLLLKSAIHTTLPISNCQNAKMRSISVLRHGHINQFASSYDQVMALYRNVFDADVFLEFEEPDFGGKNAVYVVGSTAIELFAPTDPNLSIGASIQRFGQRWHSLEWTVPNLDEAVEIIHEHGIRITDRSPGNYVFLHPRDCFGLCLEITDHYFPNDPRDKDDWDASRGANSNPVGINGGPIITLCVSDVDEAINWLSTFTGTQADDRYQSTHRTGRAVNFGDHIIEFVSPLPISEDSHLSATLDARGASIYSVTLPVADLIQTEKHLANHGLVSTRAMRAEQEFLEVNDEQTYGALFKFITR